MDEEKDSTLKEQEDDLFSDPDEDEQYQFDDSEQLATTADDSFADSELEDDDINEPSVGGFSQTIQEIIEKVRNKEPRKLIIPALIGVLVFIVMIYGFVKLVSVFSSAPPAEQQAEIKIIEPKSSPVQEIDSKSSSSDVVQSITKSTDADLAAESQMIDKKSTVIDSSKIKQVDLALQKVIATQVVLDKRLQELEQQKNEWSNKLNQLEQQAAEHSAKFNDLTSNVKMLEKRVTKLNRILLDLLTVAKKKSKMVVEQRSSAAIVAPTSVATTNKKQNLSYYVQAIVPGRAWLKDSNGQIITVTTGDQLANYGIIIAIDPKTGVIRTDSGVTIEYGIDQF